MGGAAAVPVPKRAHDEGAVEAIAALHLACRQHEGAHITEWLCETEAAYEFTGLRPDAAFTLETGDGRSLMAWYEHDTGTETLDRLTAKVAAYRQRRSPLLPYNRNVLIGCATTARVQALAEAISDTGDLAVAAALHHTLPPTSRALPDTTGVLTAPAGSASTPPASPVACSTSPTSKPDKLDRKPTNLPLADHPTLTRALHTPRHTPHTHARPGAHPRSVLLESGSHPAPDDIVMSPTAA
ncbi:hypothetical protein GCM10029992_36700 [Glycomyces albus]